MIAADLAALDDTALTMLAFEHGLAPSHSQYWNGYVTLGWNLWEPWTPTVTVAQARVTFFDGLPARGWRVHYTCNPLAQYGVADAWKDAWYMHVDWGESYHIMGSGTCAYAPSEARALVLCAVLAVVSDAESLRQEVRDAPS